MSFNEIDEIIDSKLNNLASLIKKEKIYDKILKDSNFVRFQSVILEFMLNFEKKYPSIFSKKLQKSQLILEDNILSLMYYYFFIGLSYYYKGGRDSFITNIIEISKNQAKSKIKIPGFFNSNSNGIIIKTYDLVKNLLELVEQKTIDRIKSTITNAPIKFQSTQEFIKNISIDFFKNNIVDNSDNFHILIKTIIIKNIYQACERANIISIINQEKNLKGEFRYITIVTAKVGKMVDYNVIEKMLTPEQIKDGFADDIYNYIKDFKENKKQYIKNRENIVDYLFSKKILVPISEEFLKYHKNTEKYQTINKSNKDDTKAKYIISKLKQIKNYYSDVVKNNPKRIIDVKNLFYKPMIEKMTTLINQTENTKIINKLKQTDNKDLNEVLNDMDNLTKYSYINFNNFSKDGIKIRPSKPTESVRFVNLDEKNKNKLLETRMGNDLLDLNVIGVMFLPNKKYPNLLNKKNLIKVDEKSPYQDFIKKVQKEFIETKSNKIYFWLFNTKKDELKTDLYQDVSGTDISNTIQVFLQDFYDKYYQMLLTKTKNILKQKNIKTFLDFYKIIDKISTQYADIYREPEIFNNLTKYYRQHIIKNLPITPDELDNIIPNKNKNLIKLPTIKSKNINNKLIEVKNIKNTKNKDSISITSICIHHIIWRNIISMKKNNIDNFNQKIFDFVKKYIKINDSGEYICKSCDEIIPIKKYVYSGTYIEEVDTFLTTSIAVNQNLEKIPKYKKYNRTIKNLDRLVERIGLLSNFNIFLGNTPIIKLRRRIIIKDTIDLILEHTDTLSKIMKSRKDVENRGSVIKQRYNIDPNYSKLFFFQLKDDIFLTSSEDTDKYKIIKYNNLITYLMLFIMLEINSGQILGIKENKFYNFYFYQKFITLFSKLKIRLSEKEVITIDKLPLLAYTIYIFSGMIAKDSIWFSDKTTKNINIEAQKEIIHSIVDLINSIIETSFKKNKSFIYDILSSRILNQIKGTYKDNRVFKIIQDEKNNNIIIDKSTKKIQFKEKKHKGIFIKDIITENNLVDYKLSDKDYDNCFVEHKKLKSKKYINYGDYITDELYENKYKEQIKSFLKKICSRDKLEKWEKNLCNKYGPTFSKNLDKKDLNIFLENIKNNQIKKFIKFKLLEDKYHNNNKDLLIRRNNIIDRWHSIYKKENGLQNYINKFTKKIISIIGKKIKTDTLDLHILDDIYIIDHDYLGNPRKNILNIYKSEGKFKQEDNNIYFKNPTIYFFDTKSRTYMYYHLITKQYLGYSTDKKKFQKLTPNNYLKIQFSLKNMILNLGLINKYERILDYFQTIPSTQTVVKTILNNRIKNLRNIILKSNSIIYQIKYKNNNNNNNNTKENIIVNKFIQRINFFKHTNSEGKKSVFKNINYIFNFQPKDITGEFIINYNNYLKTSIFKKINNIDNNLIFYLIFEMNKLLEYNTNKNTLIELSYLIISIIKYIFELYYNQHYSTDVQKFYFLSKLIDDDSMVDERVSFVGMYCELLKKDDLDNEQLKEKQYDAEQEFQSLDIDYESEDDDFAFDNDIEIPDN